MISESKGNGYEDEEEEFLKIMKQSKYDVVDQLKKTPAKISLYSLILSSEAHCSAIKRVLDQAYIPKDVTLDRVEGIVGAIKTTNTITFKEDEVFPHAMGRPKALYITLKCQCCNIAKVLIDGGSTFNVLPYSTLQQLPIDYSAIEPSETIIKAFDRSLQEITGTIDLQLEIGPTTFLTRFQVMCNTPIFCLSENDRNALEVIFSLEFEENPIRQFSEGKLNV